MKGIKTNSRYFRWKSWVPLWVPTYLPLAFATPRAFNRPFHCALPLTFLFPFLFLIPASSTTCKVVHSSVGLLYRNPWIRSGFPYVYARPLCCDLPALCALRALSWVFLCSAMGSLVLWAIHSPIRYPTFSQRVPCYVAHTFAASFPIPLLSVTP